MIHRIANPKMVIAVVISLLMLSLPPLPVLKVGAGGKATRQVDLRQIAVKSEVFEQRRSDGQVLARLRVSPAKSPKEIPFQVEDLKTSGKLMGAVELGSSGLKVRFTEMGSMARLGINIRRDQKEPDKTRVTLQYNKSRCDVTIDLGTGRAIVERIKGLVEQGKRTEAERLLPQLKAVISGRDEYIAFTKLIASSPAFALLSTTASLKATLTPEEMRRSVAVQAIDTAVSMLAPKAVKSSLGFKEGSRIQEQRQPRFVKASYSPGAPGRAAASPAPMHDEIECNLCPLWTSLFAGGCFVNYYFCQEFFPSVDWWLCESMLFFCIEMAILFWDWCVETYCHAHPNPPDNPAASGDDMLSGEALYPDQSLTSENGMYTFIMQLDGNLVLYRNSDGAPLWDSGTVGNPDAYCIFYGDDSLSIYNSRGQLLRRILVSGSPDSYLLVQNDGNVVVYRPGGVPVWATNTVQQ